MFDLAQNLDVDKMLAFQDELDFFENIEHENEQTDTGEIENKKKMSDDDVDNKIDKLKKISKKGKAEKTEKVKKAEKVEKKEFEVKKTQVDEDDEFADFEF